MDKLEEIMALIRRGGWRALVIVDQGGTRFPYVGATLDGQGKMCNQTWATHSTPALALAQLAAKLGETAEVVNKTRTPAQILAAITTLLDFAAIPIKVETSGEEDIVGAVLKLKERADKAEAMVAEAAAYSAKVDAGLVAMKARLDKAEAEAKAQAENFMEEQRAATERETV